MKKTLFMLLLLLCLSIFIPAEIQASKTPKIKNAEQLQKHLRKKYPKLKTNIKTFDVSKCIFVVNSHDEMYCFDMAIFIPWSVIEETNNKVHSLRRYSKEEKKAFDKALKVYQKKLAKETIKVMPKKKFRGGFMEYGYRYPYLQTGYYEYAIFGWKNYKYLDIEKFSPNIDDTKVSKFEWYDFEIDDSIDLYLY